eukprot:5956727-Amphidinium_carterae.1
MPSAFVDCSHGKGNMVAFNDAAWERALGGKCKLADLYDFNRKLNARRTSPNGDCLGQGQVQDDLRLENCSQLAQKVAMMATHKQSSTPAKDSRYLWELVFTGIATCRVDSCTTLVASASQQHSRVELLSACVTGAPFPVHHHYHVRRAPIDTTSVKTAIMFMEGPCIATHLRHVLLCTICIQISDCSDSRSETYSLVTHIVFIMLFP